MLTPRKNDLTRLRTQLEERGLRVTYQRMAVLRVLQQERRPMSHGELAEQLEDATMNRATVYRNLLTLSEAGMVVRTQLGDGVWRYEVPGDEISGHQAHPHLVCTQCSQVLCLPESAVQLAQGMDPAIEVQLRGRCQACREAGSGTRP